MFDDLRALHDLHAAHIMSLAVCGSSSTSAKYQRPVMWDAGAGKWVTDQKRLSAFEACLAKNKVESSAVMEYDVESVIHPTSGGASKVLRPSLDTQPTAVSSRRHYPLGF